jgi:hypothetical protein
MPISEAELLRRALESRLGDVYTTLPGRIEKYDAGTNKADVSPTIKRPVPTTDDSISFEQLCIIPNVTICFPCGGGFTVSWPLDKGDHVILLFTTYSINQWLKSGITSEPGDLRLHHLANALALPMLRPNHPPFLSSSEDGPAYIIDGPLIKLGSEDNTGFAALAAQTNANFQAIIDLFDAWTPVPNDGGAALKTAAASLSFDSVACERVKIR